MVSKNRYIFNKIREDMKNGGPHLKQSSLYVPNSDVLRWEQSFTAYYRSDASEYYNLIVFSCENYRKAERKYSSIIDAEADRVFGSENENYPTVADLRDALGENFDLLKSPQ